MRSTSTVDTFRNRVFGGLAINLARLARTLVAVVFATSAHSASWVKTTDWTRGDPPKILAPTATHVCLLTRITGRFRGAGERIALLQQGSSWVLNGTSNQKELAASATCAAKGDFQRYRLNPARMGALIWPNKTNGSCSSKVYALGGNLSTHAFFITGIAGKFSGDGEAVGAGAAGKALPGAGAIFISGCSGFVDGTRSSFNDAKGNSALYWTRQGTITTLAGGNTTFHANDSAGHEPSVLEKFLDCFPGCGLDTTGTAPDPSSSTDLAPVEQSLCGLVGVQGKLQGYGEYVRIGIRKRPITHELWWTLEVETQADLNWIWGSARCLARKNGVAFPG